MANRKTRLEESIPTKEINEISRKEKLGRAPIFEMHYYWARKPLITNRAVIFGALSHSISINEFKTIIGINTAKPKENEQVLKKIPWKTHQELFNRIKHEMTELYGDDLVILDPFAGTGMIPFEALRIGLNVEAIDYNPLAYLIMKGTLEYPKKIGDILLNGFDLEKMINSNFENLELEKKLNLPSFEKVANEIISEMENELKDLYPKHNGNDVLAYIWAFNAKCDTCGGYTPTIHDFTLEDKKGKKTFLKPIINEKDVKFDISKEEPDISPFKLKNNEIRCAHCYRIITRNELLKQFENNEISEVPVAVYVADGKSRWFEPPSEEDFKILENARKRFTPDLFSFIPSEEPSPAVVAKNWLKIWRNFYNPRQLLVMSTLAKKIKEKTDELYKINPEYAAAIGTYLAMLLGKHLDYNSRITRWVQVRNTIANSMALRGLGMTWRYAEPNPFVKFSGSLKNQIKNILDGIKFSKENLSNSKGDVKIRQESIISWNPGKKYKLIITDPPYGDDVAYNDFSDYFYVWESRAIGYLFNWNSTVTEKDEEIDVNRNDRTWKLFWDRFDLAIKKIYEILDDDGLFIAYFANKNPEVWKRVMEYYINAGFVITSAVPLSTENTNNVVSINKISIFYSLIITARKRKENKSGQIYQVKEEVKEKIRKKIQEFYEFGYNQGEMLQAAIGIALEVITSYSDIVSFNKKDATKTAIDFAQAFLIEELITTDLEKAGLKNHLPDPETIIYFNYLKSERQIDKDTFNQIIKALNISDSEMFKKNLIKLKDNNIYFNDAFERAKFVEENGEDPIIGNSNIDWIHRAIRMYVHAPKPEVILEISEVSGIPKEDLSKMLSIMHIYSPNDKECRLAGELSDVYERTYGSKLRDRSIESYDKKNISGA